MHQHPFIFCDQRKYRIRRHLVFWTSWTLFQGFLYAFVSMNGLQGYLQRLPLTMLDSLLFMPSHMFLSYTLMYFVIPVYVVKHRYGPAVLWCGLLILTTGVLAALISQYVVAPIRELLTNTPYFKGVTGIKVRFTLSVLAGLRGGLTVGGIAAAIKLMKHWYVEGQRNLQLQKEHIESQLQILKAQVHPHFLFNTLNNIYAHTQNTAPDAARMLMGLADMLRYMLYECNQPLVPLAKELRMIEDYIGLEQMRYGNKLELHISLPEKTEGYYIAPLLLLPFVENVFKHGTSNMLDQPWLSLRVSLRGNMLTAKLVNGKPPDTAPSKRPGIGIENVRRRLELLYPQKHQLIINNEEEVFIVNLKLEVERKTQATVRTAERAASAI